MSGTTVTVHDDNRKRGRATARILRAVSADVELVDHVGDASLSVVEVDDEGALDAVVNGAPRDRVVVVGERFSKPALARWLETDRIRHLLTRGESFEEDLLATAQKIVRREVFGLEKYFPWGSSSASYSLRTSRDRDELLSFVRGFGEQLGTQSRRLELYCGVADELATNALYNAPTDATGARCFAHLSRNVDVDLDEEIRVQVAGDGRRLGIAVSDPFGSLSVQTVSRYLAKGLRAGEDQIDSKPGGAGLGFLQIYESVSQLIVNVAPGKRTEIIGLIDVRGRYRDFVESPKSLNLFGDR